MDDMSYLDRKYFVDANVYNCPFCNRNNVQYILLARHEFDWNAERKCYIHLVKCTSCGSTSMHLSYEDALAQHLQGPRMGSYWKFASDLDLDSKIFYSVPTSFFVIDSRIPLVIREQKVA
jgi:hypothetical protein